MIQSLDVNTMNDLENLMVMILVLEQDGFLEKALSALSISYEDRVTFVG